MTDGRIVAARARRETTHRKLVEAAGAAFASIGYAGTSPDGIARDAGVTRATFYLHFPTKAAVFKAVLDALVARLSEAVQGVDLTEEAATPAAQLTGNLLRVLDVLLEDRGLARVLLVEAPGKEPAVDADLDVFFSHVRGMIREALTDGRPVGLVRPLDVDVCAHALLGAVQGVMVGRLVRDPRPLGVRARRELAREILTFALCGVGEPGLRDAIG